MITGDCVVCLSTPLWLASLPRPPMLVCGCRGSGYQAVSSKMHTSLCSITSLRAPSSSPDLTSDTRGGELDSGHGDWAGLESDCNWWAACFNIRYHPSIHWTQQYTACAHWTHNTRVQIRLILGRQTKTNNSSK